MLLTYKIREGYFKDGSNISKTSASISFGVQTDLKTDESTSLQAECFYCLREGCPSFSTLNGFKLFSKIGSRSLGSENWVYLFTNVMTLSLQAYDQIHPDFYCLFAFLSRVSFLNSEITLAKQAYYNYAFNSF